MLSHVGSVIAIFFYYNIAKISLFGILPKNLEMQQFQHLFINIYIYYY